MEPTTIHLHTAFPIDRVDERIFGGFLEHLGRAVYGGVYEPHSDLADKDGFRRDVLEALRGLDMTAMRYPGGNFASGYHWLDGVGPCEQRPIVRDLAWQSVEPNHFGTDEFVRLCGKLGWSPMLTVNLGTGTPEEARNWVEYCNGPAGTRYADLRAASGSPEPYGVGLWCLGNEMDGPWQLGHVPAEPYALRARQAAAMMKAADRSIELVVCGSCGVGLPTYMEWDRVALECLGDLADYVSLHRYVGNPHEDTPDFLAVTNGVDRQIEQMDAACRFVQARRRADKRPYLCFDEWNVWYKNHQSNGEGKYAPPLLEEVYNLEDALVVAGFLNSFLRHADAVKIANLAQIVNVIAPILTQDDHLLRQATYYPFAMYSRRREGISLRTVVEGPTYEAKTNGRAHFIDASAVLDAPKLHVFATNRSLDEAAEVTVAPADRSVKHVDSAELLTGPGPKAANSFEQPDTVRPVDFAEAAVAGGRATLKLPPLSLVAATLELS